MSEEVKRYKDGSNLKSRYKYQDRIVYSDGVEIQETADRIDFTKDATDKFYTVQAGYEGRLDLISYMYYGTPMYWWAIAAASGIDDPFKVKVGDRLRIPTKTRVMGW